MLVIRMIVFTALFIFGTILCVQANPNQILESPSIIINIPSRTLELYSGKTLVKVYQVAVGKPSTPSPMGQFRIFDKEINPVWYPPLTGEVVPSGPGNPLGYRWMEFAPHVGVHGTNAPWSIGSAVSHGCIRMHEQDVEEIFAAVPTGTPVQVTYDRVKVRIDSGGAASVGIYPDVYGRKDLTLAEVKNCLAENGLSGILSDSELASMISEQSDRQIVFAQLGNIKLNDQPLAEHALVLNNIVYLPVKPVADVLQVNLTWDEQNKLLHDEKIAVPGVVKGDNVYVTAADAQLLFGGQAVWQAGDNCLEINVLTLSLNGKIIPAAVQMIDGIPAVPLQVLAVAFGRQIIQSEDKSFWVQGEAVPVVFIADQPYLQITKINELFQAYVYWNQQKRSVELTYPFQVKGGTD